MNFILKLIFSIHAYIQKARAAWDIEIEAAYNESFIKDYRTLKTLEEKKVEEAKAEIEKIKDSHLRENRDKVRALEDEILSANKRINGCLANIKQATIGGNIRRQKAAEIRAYGRFIARHGFRTKKLHDDVQISTNETSEVPSPPQAGSDGMGI